MHFALRTQPHRAADQQRAVDAMPRADQQQARLGIDRCRRAAAPGGKIHHAVEHAANVGDAGKPGFGQGRGSERRQGRDLTRIGKVDQPAAAAGEFIRTGFDAEQGLGAFAAPRGNQPLRETLLEFTQTDAFGHRGP
jgi:hypothetical protein